MNRLAFLRRMALAAAACAFIDVPWPKREPDGPLVAWIGSRGFPTITAAIEAADKHDVITVVPGRYDRDAVMGEIDHVTSSRCYLGNGWTSAYMEHEGDFVSLLVINPRQDPEGRLLL